jgi:hypothetical protein
VVNSMEPGLRDLLLAQEFRNLTQVQGLTFRFAGRRGGGGRPPEEEGRAWEVLGSSGSTNSAARQHSENGRTIHYSTLHLHTGCACFQCSRRLTMQHQQRGVMETEQAWGHEWQMGGIHGGWVLQRCSRAPYPATDFCIRIGFDHQPAT